MKENLVDILILTAFCCSIVVLAIKVAGENIGTTPEAYSPSNSASWEENKDKGLKEWHYVESIPVNNTPMKHIIRATTGKATADQTTKNTIHF